MFIMRSMHNCNQGTCQSKCSLWLLVVVLLFPSYQAPAKERMNRMLDRSGGLPIESLYGYAQDTNGFFWISTAAAVLRYGGTEFRQWARRKLTGWHYMVYAAPDGD